MPVVFGRGFHHDGDVVKARIVDERLESNGADKPFSDVLVPIDVRAEILFAVVGMHRFELGEPNQFLEPLEGGVERLWSSNVVTSHEDVTGVETDGKPVRVLAHLKDRGDLFEGAVERATLSGRGLHEKRNGVWGGVKYL